MNGRVIPNGGEVKRLREAKGLRHADLAAKTECSEKTLGRVESGQPCYAKTLHGIAAALGVEYASLVAKAEWPANVPVRLADASRISHLEELVRDLSAILGSEALPAAAGEENGVAVLTIQPEHLRALLHAFIDQKLAAVGITHIKIPMVGGPAGETVIYWGAEDRHWDWYDPDEAEYWYNQSVGFLAPNETHLD